jgi:glycine dehydrogenase subunit 1
VKLSKPAAEVVERLAQKGVLAGVPVSRLSPNAGLDNLLLVASTEVNTEEDRAALCAALKEVL